MATLASFVSFSLPHPQSSLPSNHHHHHLNSLSSFRCPFLRNPANPTRLHPPRTTTVAFSASSFDDLYPRDHNFSSKKSVLLNLIQEIEPLDVSVIQKDVPITTLDAMKRTISGMLGLLPSDRFQVLIEAMWDPLSKLLVSSMMTGYTLRNAEYRLSFEKNFGMYERSTEVMKTTESELEALRKLLDCEKRNELSGKHAIPETRNAGDSNSETVGAQDIGEITSEAHRYILELKSRLSSVQKELREVKRKSAALQMQKFVGEEKNDLLDYLRSLSPEKVAELSEPTCPELKEAIYSVVHGILATLSPKMHSKAPISENNLNGKANAGNNEDNFNVVENASFQYQPMISLTRDYLARLLFWCMLLGHYLRGLEYRLELKELLSLPDNLKNYPFDGEQAA